MKTRLLPFALPLSLAFVLPACGGDDTDTSGTGATDSAEFAEAIPDGEQLALEVDDGAGADEGATAGGLTGQPSEFRALTREAIERVNRVREETQARIDALIADVEPETYTEGNLECRRWKVDGERAHWQLTSCRKDAKNRHYAFALKGRPLDAGDDALAVVVAGEGKVLARFDDKKRGSGQIGFDFDQYAALTGEDGPAGRLGIGFRAAGRVRQLNVALHDFTETGDDTPVTGLYRFKHIHQVGGRIVVLAHGDVLTRGEDDQFVSGEDGQVEVVRAALAWNRGVGARAVAAVCGGTAGEDTCARVVQCWRADGVVTQESADDQAEANGNGNGRRPHARIQWTASECPALADGLDDLDDAPSADDVSPPAGDALPDEPSPAQGE